MKIKYVIFFEHSLYKALTDQQSTLLEQLISIKNNLNIKVIGENKKSLLLNSFVSKVIKQQVPNFNLRIWVYIVWLYFMRRKTIIIDSCPYPELRNWGKFFYSSFFKKFKIAYLNYGVSNIMNSLDIEYKLDYFSKINAVLTSNSMEGDLYSKFHTNIQVVPIGDPLMYKLLEIDRVQTKSKLIWAPHWTSHELEEISWGNWPNQIPHILEFAQANSHIQIVFRPHPLFYINGVFGSSETPEYSKKMWKVTKYHEKEMLKLFLSIPNVQVSTKSLYQDLKDSDLLLTDGISIIPYGVAAGLKVLVTRHKKSPSFGALGAKVINDCNLITSCDELLTILDDYFNGMELPRIEIQRKNLRTIFDKTRENPGVKLVNFCQN